VIRLFLNRGGSRYGWLARVRQEYWLRIHIGPLGILNYARGSANLRDAQTVTRARFNDVVADWLPDDIADEIEHRLFDK
jgi:hypothetical protein